MTSTERLFAWMNATLLFGLTVFCFSTWTMI